MATKSGGLLLRGRFFERAFFLFSSTEYLSEKVNTASRGLQILQKVSGSNHFPSPFGVEEEFLGYLCKLIHFSGIAQDGSPISVLRSILG
jgi:hypothetical protein